MADDTPVVPTGKQFVAMLMSFLRVGIAAFITVVLASGGFDDIDWTAAGWSALTSALVVLYNFLNAGDPRYGRGADPS